MNPVTREDAFLEFQINRLIQEIREIKTMIEPKPVVEKPVSIRGRKKRDTL
jgi:hypothetical protein